MEGDNHHHINVVSNRIQALILQINDFCRYEFPSSSPIVLGEILKKILVRLQNELSKSYIRIYKDKIDDVQKNILTINCAVISIGKLIEAIQGAQITQVALPVSSIAEAFENVGQRIAYGTHAIIYPRWVYNASFIDIIPSLTNWVEQIGPDVTKEVFKGEPKHIIIITFPAIEEKNILRHSILAHELGHFVDSIYKFNSTIGEKALSEAIKASEKYLTNPEIRKSAVDVTRKWIPEVIADILGISILGPAYIFALDDVMHFPPTLIHASQLSTSHPPFDLRLEIAIKYLQFTYIDELRDNIALIEPSEAKIATQLSKWLDNLNIKKPKERYFSELLDPLPEEDHRVIYSIAYKALQGVVTKLNVEIRKMENQGWIFQSSDMVDAIKLQVLLDNGLPPSELPRGNGSPPSKLTSDNGLRSNINVVPSFSAIMNSGWIYFLRNEHQFTYDQKADVYAYDPEKIFKKYMSMQNLIAKAIEISLFRSEYSKRMG